MASDAEIRSMLQRRSARVGTEGLLEDARLGALAISRSPMERVGLRAIPVAAFTCLVIAVVAIGGFVVVQRNPATLSSSSRSPTTTVGSSSTQPASGAASESAAPTAAAVACQIDPATCVKVLAMAKQLDPAPFQGDARVVVGSICGPGQFCAFGFRALVIATHTGWLHRTDLHMSVVTGTQGPESAFRAPADTTVPPHLVGLLPPSAVPGPSSPVFWSVRDVLDDPPAQEPVELILKGWLSVTPPLPCQPEPVPSGSLDFRCNEQDWLTDEKFQPWSNGTVLTPKVGIRVPNGSYKTFSNTPGVVNGMIQPSQGTWLVRVSPGNMCARNPSLVCIGYPPVFVEILERIS